MITSEPVIHVGIYEKSPVARGSFSGQYSVNGTAMVEGPFAIRPEGSLLVMFDESGNPVASGAEIGCIADRRSRVTLHDVTIGIQFHWERKESQRFQGGMRFHASPGGGITAVNDILLEDYLKSVISSEMSSEAPLEFLKAHAITSRSWLVSMLERSGTGVPPQPPPGGPDASGEIVRWYTREDHTDYDVCADDHCQRYQGETKIASVIADEAVMATRGQFLVHDGRVCDARFYKACGGRTEEFRNAWEDLDIPYLTSVADSVTRHAPVTDEAGANKWIRSHPEAFCNTTDRTLLRQVLPSFDQETVDFFRWQVRYARQDLEKIISERGGIEIGTLMDLVPLRRGPSGRITRLSIVGTKRSIIAGKELEIRRLLSRSHLYSSAFVVDTVRDEKGIPAHFVLRGAGWGHGVGLCQIGAAMMCAKGYSAEETVLHYFPGAQVKRLY